MDFDHSSDSDWMFYNGKRYRKTRVRVRATEKQLEFKAINPGIGVFSKRGPLEPTKGGRSKPSRASSKTETKKEEKTMARELSEVLGKREIEASMIETAESLNTLINVRRLAIEQAGNDMLWLTPETPLERLLQNELRLIHLALT